MSNRMRMKAGRSLKKGENKRGGYEIILESRVTTDRGTVMIASQ